MKGLLRKDFYMLWHYCKSFLLLILVFSLVTLAEPNSFYTLYPVMVGSVLPITVISYEERCKWSSYCQTLPVSKKTVVVEKYILTGICSAAILSLSAITQCIAMLRRSAFSWSGYAELMSTLLVLSLIGPSITLPLIFKLGSEKGRYAYYFIIGGACGLSVYFSGMQFPALPIPAFVMPILAFALYGASCLIAIHFYQKREL